MQNFTILRNTHLQRVANTVGSRTGAMKKKEKFKIWFTLDLKLEGLSWTTGEDEP